MAGAVSLERESGKMLTEHYIVSLGVPLKRPGRNLAKGAGIFEHEYQPLQQQRAVFPKSATPANGLAVADTHIFAAQHDTGLLHVYSRDQGRQEGTVAFNERISCIALACNDAVLLLGTQQGRVFAWEVCTGRQVSTTQAHLHAVTALCVDATSNFLLSASNDAAVHVWSIPALLSFATAPIARPLTTFSSHRADITALCVGHAASHCNFALSFSTDRTCLIWDYRANHLLRTYLLPAVPSSAVLDPADRIVYVGYEDGSVQSLDLYTSLAKDLTAVHAGNDAAVPVQPPPKSLWSLSDSSYGSVLSMSISHDGSTIITGHQSGNVLTWDVARGQARALGHLPFHAPVSNLIFLPVTALRDQHSPGKSIRINEIVKPKFGAWNTPEGGAVPANYNMHVQLSADLAATNSEFRENITTPTFSPELLDEGLSELASWGRNAWQVNRDAGPGEDDFTALDGPASIARATEQENAHLRAQLRAMQNVQKKVLEKMTKLSDEKRALLKKEQRRLARRSANGQDGVSNEEDNCSD
ncbi:hypothetical protein AC579_8304 [Pseudocercospora musae]|uniref:Pre-rRNA-processing protein IPI3 n=1 Tax=Pseudocercospora musae TaxID=113226 RepID=A0A139I2B2_9PEZI|nr:hypothetical protein AC579_8304 [Pseudocercospora musae]